MGWDVFERIILMKIRRYADAEDLEANSSITDVTVFIDRALVTRSTSLELKPAHTRSSSTSCRSHFGRAL